MKYAGLVYYEEKGVEDLQLVTFTAAKKLDALIQVRMYSYSHNVLIILFDSLLSGNTLKLRLVQIFPFVSSFLMITLN